MRAVIPVAGVGTRLRPHTYSLPKVLLNVAGKPILAHILDALIEQGIRKATIITGYMGRLVEEYVRSRYDIEVEYVVQEALLGLGHAIWTARKTFDKEPLMIILGDTIFDADLGLSINSGYNCLGVKEVEDPKRFGVVVTDKDGFITKLIEKPDIPISRMAIVGIYYITNAILLKHCLEEIIDKDIRTRDEYQLTDALQLMLDKGEKFKTFDIEGWYDCGKPETLLSTNRFLLEKNNFLTNFPNSIIIPPVYIAENAIVERSVIGPYTSIAEDAEVCDSVIRDSIISEGAKVSISLLDRSIVGNNATVKGQFTRLNVGNSSEIKHA
ncbi:MAG: glucose-phosphate thymidylyltransferase [Bacteroidota bacterium]|nr:glucose-phosphate thymidylyltransferase [Bacteroidota bacterium]